MFRRSWRSEECYVREEGDAIHIGNSLVERILSREGGKLRTVAIVNKRTGRSWRLNTRAEVTLRFSAATTRIDIPQWRYAPGNREAVPPEDDAGFREGYHKPEFDDRDWMEVECINAATEPVDSVWPGYGWFRAPFNLPSDAAGRQIAFGLGGYDHEDWQYYRLFVNGEEIGSRELSGRWREPEPFILDPSHSAYSALRFGADNLVAIQAGSLNKMLPDMIPAEAEHYLFMSRVSDQFVTVGPPTKDISDFQLKDWASGGDRHWIWATFWAENEAEQIRVAFNYQVRAGDPIVRKRIEVENKGASPRLLLDVDVEEFEIDGTTSDGGQGLPILIDDEAYCAIEHPAGVNQGLGDGVRLRHHPAFTLAPEQLTTSKTAIFGVTERGAAREGFLEYLRKNGRRRDNWVSVYDPFGLHDYTNPKDPMFLLTEEIALDTVKMLKELRARGITFDYYIIDHGWTDESSDLTWFKPDAFPNGPGKLVEQLHEIGVDFGLWFATNNAPASCGHYPPVQDCITPHGSNYHLRSKRELCMAAEPYRTIFRNALLHHIRENKVRAIKIDMARLYCNSTEHGHLPGKYSLEAQMDAMVETARIVIRACPDLFLIWYWGYKSPFWMLYGDTIFDKGLRMEAAAVASPPNPMFRSSVSLNLDQAARYGEFTPLIVQDSLGIWIGEGNWANGLGKDDWRDAWVLDLARGNLVSQPWGNLGLFDEEDFDFLAEWYQFMRENWRLYLHTRPVFGDPWKAEAYGYAGGDGTHAVVTVSNPGFNASGINVRLDAGIGLQPSDRGFLVRQRYPRRGVLPLSGGARYSHGETVFLPLRPFEVAVLEVGEDLDTSGWPAWSAPANADSQELAVETQAASPDAIHLTVPPPDRTDVTGFAARAMTGQMFLPTIHEPCPLALIVRLKRDGAHWYHRDIRGLMALRAQVRGQELRHETVPGYYLANGPGSPWLIFRLPVQPVHSEQPLMFELAGLLPEEVQWQIESWCYYEWWKTR